MLKARIKTKIEISARDNIIPAGSYGIVEKYIINPDKKDEDCAIVVIDGNYAVVSLYDIEFLWWFDPIAKKDDPKKSTPKKTFKKPVKNKIYR